MDKQDNMAILNTFNDTIKELKKKHQEGLNLLQQMSLVFFLTPEDLKKRAGNYISSVEELFLSSKKLLYLPDETDGEDEEIEVPKDPFYSLAGNEGVYVLTTYPLRSKQYKDKKRKDGKVIYYQVKELIEDFIIRNGFIKPFSKAEIHFTHYIPEQDIAWRVPDPDNLEIKYLLDALQGYLITDDSLLNLRIIQEGEVGEKAYTKVVIKAI